MGEGMRYDGKWKSPKVGRPGAEVWYAREFCIFMVDSLKWMRHSFVLRIFYSLTFYSSLLYQNLVKCASRIIFYAFLPSYSSLT